jgi:hypothetical protein
MSFSDLVQKLIRLNSLSNSFDQSEDLNDLEKKVEFFISRFDRSQPCNYVKRYERNDLQALLNLSLNYISESRTRMKDVNFLVEHLLLDFHTILLTSPSHSLKPSELSKQLKKKNDSLKIRKK